MTNLSQYTVTIKIETGVIGHAFVTLQAPGQPPITVGYYPVVHSPSAPGIVKNDGVSGENGGVHPSDWSRSFTVSAGQYEAMLSKVAFVSNHPGGYGVAGNQCTGFVRDVLNAGGITPTGVGQLIKDNNGNILVVGNDGAMQINGDGSIDVVNATAQGMTDTQYGAGTVLSTSGSLNKSDGSYTQTLFSSTGQIEGFSTTKVLDTGVTQQRRLNAQGVLINNTEVQTYDDGTAIEIKTEGGRTYVRAVTPDENGEGTRSSDWNQINTTSTLTAEQLAQVQTNAIFSDMAGFINALRSKDKLNQALYGAKIIIDMQIKDGLSPSLAGMQAAIGGISATIGVVAGLHALQSDSTVSQLNGAEGFLDKGQLGFLNTVGALISIANLKNLDLMLENGQVGIASASVYGAWQAGSALYATANQSNTDPARTLVLITSRIPKVYLQSWPSYTGNGETNYYYMLEQTHPQNGQKIYSGVTRQDIAKFFSGSLVLPEAIAQQWQTEGQWATAHSAIEQQREQLGDTLTTAVEGWRHTDAANADCLRQVA